MGSAEISAYTNLWQLKAISLNELRNKLGFERIAHRNADRIDASGLPSSHEAIRNVAVQNTEVGQKLYVVEESN